MQLRTNQPQLQLQSFTMTSFYVWEALEKFFTIKVENELFKNELLHKLNKTLGISRLCTTPYHSMSN